MVAGDDVAGTGRRSSDRDVGRSGIDLHTVESVAQSYAAGDISADIIAFHLVCVPCNNGDAVPLVAGDEIAGVSRRTADGGTKSALDVHAITPVGQDDLAGEVCSDVVPFHHVPEAGDEDPVPLVPRDEV